MATTSILMRHCDGGSALSHSTGFVYVSPINANPGKVKAMQQARFKGSFPALVTPFRGGSLD